MSTRGSKKKRPAKRRKTSSVKWKGETSLEKLKLIVESLGKVNGSLMGKSFEGYAGDLIKKREKLTNDYELQLNSLKESIESLKHGNEKNKKAGRGRYHGS